MKIVTWKHCLFNQFGLIEYVVISMLAYVHVFAPAKNK
jgi:hypothetical protein